MSLCCYQARMKIQRSESCISQNRKDNQAGVALERVKRSRGEFSRVCVGMT